MFPICLKSLCAVPLHSFFACLHWIDTSFNSSLHYNDCQVWKRLDLYHNSHDTKRIVYHSSVTSVLLYHRIRRISKNGPANKAGTTWGQKRKKKKKSTQRLPCERQCLTGLFSSTSGTPELSMPVTPNICLCTSWAYSLLLGWVSSAKLAEGQSMHSGACPRVGPTGCHGSPALNILFVLFLCFPSSSARATPASELILSLQLIWYWAHMSARHLSKMTVENCNQPK